MTLDVALVTLHGMGETDDDYAERLFSGVRARLGADAGRVGFLPVHYQRPLQRHQDWVRAQMEAHGLRSRRARRFVLSHLSDAVGLEAGKDADDSSYTGTQACIAERLLEAYAATADGPVIVVAQSLGAQVVSSYLYDAQRWRASRDDARIGPPSAGLWRDGRRSIEATLRRPVSDAELDYLRGDTVRALLTTGCNIPVFVAAHARMNVRAIEAPTVGFEWHNYYDRDDILGWPLQPLGGGYEQLVEDHAVDAGRWYERWNWLSHRGYWSQRDVLVELVRQLRRAAAARVFAPSAAASQAVATAP